MQKTLLPLLFLALISSTSLRANVIGSDAQNFNPTPDGLDFVTVHSSETLDAGIFNFGLFFNYAENTFPAFDGPGQAPSQSLLDKNDSLTSMDLNFAFGVTDKLQLGFSFPFIIDQSIDNGANLGRFENKGNTEIRGAVKYSIFERTRMNPWGLAVVGSVNFNRIENNPYVGDDPNPTWNLEVAIDRSFGLLKWGINFGHRWRNPGTPLTNLGIDPLPRQYIASTAVSYHLVAIDTKLIAEIFSAFPSEKTGNLSDRQNTTIEGIIGVKHDLTRQIALHGGFGSELDHGNATPDWRVYTGVNWAIGPVFPEEEKPFKEVKIESPTGLREIRITLRGFYFPFDSDKLQPSSMPIFDALVERFKHIESKIHTFEIEGHTDSIGAESYNQQLSEKRAATVKNILQERLSIKEEDIKYTGFGESQPVADNSNYQGRQLNRRVEIRIFMDSNKK